MGRRASGFVFATAAEAAECAGAGSGARLAAERLSLALASMMIPVDLPEPRSAISTFIAPQVGAAIAESFAAALSSAAAPLDVAHASADAVFASAHRHNFVQVAMTDGADRRRSGSWRPRPARLSCCRCCASGRHPA